MSNEVATHKAMTPEQRRADIMAKARARREEGTAPSGRRAGTVYAKMNGNDGSLTAGRQGTPITPDQRFVLVLDECKYERPFWAAGKVGKRLSVGVLDGSMPDVPDGEPEVGSLPKPRERDGWGESITLQMSGIDGGDFEGVVVMLEASNQSQRDQANELLAQVFQQIETEEGQKGYFLPIVTVEVDFYHNKTYSKDVYFPVFKVVGWTNLEGSDRIEAWDAADDDVLG